MSHTSDKARHRSRQRHAEPPQAAADPWLETLVAAFRDDPIFVTLSKELQPRLRFIRAMMAAQLWAARTQGHRHGEEHAVVLWYPPGRYPGPPRVQLITTLRVFLAGLRWLRWTQIPFALWLFKQIAIQQKRFLEQHGYLAVLAVHPDHQGRGHGGRRLRELPHDMYLETTRLENVQLYRQFGFRVVHEIVADGRTHAWCMLRSTPGA